MNHSLNRRRFFKITAGTTLGSLAVGSVPFSYAAEEKPESRRIFKAIKFGMFNENIPMAEKFRLLKEMGFDGVELDSPGGQDKAEALKASRDTGLPVHGVVDSIHWGTRLSDPDPAVRAKGLEGLKTAIRESHFVGGYSVLLVPGKVSDPENENQEQVWHRSIEQIRQALPLAARLGIRILIENVWNGFCYQPDGSDNQTADQLAAYIDDIGSPWVGSYFDIGNHRKFAKPEEWIRTLGRRIVKLDVKDWSRANGWTKIGEGDMDWPAVRRALRDIGYSGWATAEVAGGNRDRIREIGERMDRYLLG